MYLVSQCDQEVLIDGEPVTFERWNTQCSYKYTPGEFRQLASSCGFKRVDFWKRGTQAHRHFWSPPRVLS